MKYTTIVLALLFCMLLTGCHGSEASSSTADGTTTVTTTTTTVTVSEQANDTSDSNIADTEIKTTTKKSTDTSSEIGMQEGSAPADDANIVIGDDSSADSAKPSETKSTTTAKPQTTSDADSEVDNGNVMTDDGLDWSPLVPVN